MRLTQAFFPTLKEAPTEAEVVSHSLMVRAGLIRRLAAGVYIMLPLGLRVQKKVEAIVREEMDRAGGQEVLLPVLLPAELWRETGRWEEYGKELMRLQDRHERDFCLGPTHEEVITDLIRREIRSYRSLPLTLYQIQTKFRDEIRPRFGVMRGREFTMKDAYSFDRDDKGAEESYHRMYDAYTRIFTRCGLQFSSVEADPGIIGGSFSHEFMVLADTGEEAIVGCGGCHYAANVEKTPFSTGASAEETGPKVAELEKVFTPNLKTAEEVAAYLKSDLHDLAKTLIYQADGNLWAVMIPGDCQVNQLKLKNSLGAADLSMADPETTERVTGAPVGFAGPIGLKDIPIVADHTLSDRENLIVGANEADHHYRGAKPGRDFEVREYTDLRLARTGDPCPRCGKPLALRRGIEVGHIFKLGTKYSQTLGATFLDAQGQERLSIMGCYGIGIGRTIAAAIEQNHDERGIIWPMPLAPYQVVIIPVNTEEPSVMKTAEDLYARLQGEGLETLLDDRDERAGVKFKDAELIGIPLQVIVGVRNLKAGKIEIKRRRDGATSLASLEEVLTAVLQIVKEPLPS